MSTHDARAERELDDWLTTAMAALDTALDDVLDLDAGLADARLPSLGTRLIRALDDVLDLDAGLDHILPTRHHIPSTDPIPSTDTSIRQTALARFANDFCSFPPHERLAARTWFPHQELINLQSTARHVLHARDIDLARDLDLALDLALARDLASAHARALVCARDLARTRTRARDLARTLASARDLARTRTLASTRTRTLASARDLARDLARTRTRTRTRTLARTLALDLALALAHDLASALAETPTTASRELIQAVSRLEKAITNVMGADLSRVDLRGIPLEGVLWSTDTRWPAEWEDEIRHNSIELEPGIYEIRYGGTDVNITLDAST